LYRTIKNEEIQRSVAGTKDKPPFTTLLPTSLRFARYTSIVQSSSRPLAERQLRAGAGFIVHQGGG